MHESTLARPVDMVMTPEEFIASKFLLRHREPTRGGYQLSLRHWMTWCAQHQVPVLQATRTHIEAYARWLEEERGNKPSTVCGKLNAIVGFYKVARMDGDITHDPISYLKRPTFSKESTREGLTELELKMCIDTAKKYGSAQDLALWTLLAYNGLRISEACRLDVSDLGWKEGYRTANVTRSKGNRSGHIPLAPPTSHALDRHLLDRTDGPVFKKPRVDARLDQKSANLIVKRIAKQAGIRKTITPHSLRHTHVTIALDRGHNLRDLQNSMGYADGRQLARYDRNKTSFGKSATWTVTSAIEGS